MKIVKNMKRLSAVLLTAGLLFGAEVLPVSLLTTAQAAAVPVKQAQKTGVTVYSNEKAVVDASNVTEGYLLVKYTGGKSGIKVQIGKSGGTTYTYNLNSAGNYESFPLTDGNGAYTVRVMENVSGNKYAQAYTCSVNMTLRNSFLPFLYSNQYVNFNSSSKVVSQAASICSGKSTDVDKIGAVFDYVVDGFTYDNARAASVQSGYIPNVDNVLAEKKGICFDYAAVMAAMLRSQNIPCKLVIGYAGTTYHAWINAYVAGTGWVDQVIYFDGKDWTLMDPTFVSSGKRSKESLTFTTTKTNYTQKYAY